MQADLSQTLKQQLRDVHVPEAISWWPPAPGWWLVLIAALGLLIFALVRWRGYRRKNQYRRIALTELGECFEAQLADQDSRRYLQSANAILKRCVISINPTPITVRANGAAWLELLESYYEKKFNPETRAALSESVYRADSSCDISRIHPELVDWIKHHHDTPSRSAKSAAAGVSHA